MEQHNVVLLHAAGFFGKLWRRAWLVRWLAEGDLMLALVALHKLMVRRKLTITFRAKKILKTYRFFTYCAINHVMTDSELQGYQSPQFNLKERTLHYQADSYSDGDG